MPTQRHSAPDRTAQRVREAAKACRNWAWLPLVLAVAAVVAAPEFGGDAYTWQVRYLSLAVAAVLVLATTLLFAVCAVLRAMSDLIDRSDNRQQGD